MPRFIWDNVHCVYWLCFISYYLFSGWLRSKSSTRGDPTIGQISVSWSTGGGRVAVSPLPVLVTTWGIYIIATHTSLTIVLLYRSYVDVTLLCLKTIFVWSWCVFFFFFSLWYWRRFLAWAFAIKLVTALRLLVVAVGFAFCDCGGLNARKFWDALCLPPLFYSYFCMLYCI